MKLRYPINIKKKVIFTYLKLQGLRNALKRSRTHRRSQESLELQPLHVTSNNSGSKGMLKRMPRVKSHDLSQEDGHGPVSQGEQQSGEPTISPLGAGLPLLARLRYVLN